MNSTEDRFWSKVIFPQSIGTKECWLWHAGQYKTGYGAFWFEGRMIKAHRMAYELVIGPIPDRLFCLHHCDTPLCVRPDHLFLGDHKANMIDMMLKGRAAKKLNVAKILELYELSESGKTQREIGRILEISQIQVGHILRGEQWQWVERV